MKKALLFFSILILVHVTAACGRTASAETPEASAAPRLSVFSGAAEGEELALTVVEADAYGCVFTLENRGMEENARFTYEAEGQYALLRRNADGGWERVKPIRRLPGSEALALERGERRTGVWDWSYACGPLPAGEYCLQIWGDLDRGSGMEHAAVRGTFTLEDTPPEGPGPLTLRNMPMWLQDNLYMKERNKSVHRWTQTLTPDREGWVTETDFSLYRQRADGTLEYVPPEYDLPAFLNRTVLLKAWETVRFQVELAARYGELERGDYVLRRRLVYLTEEEREAGGLPDGSFRLLPEERFVYGDTVFSTYKLRDVPQAVAPADELWDCGSLSTTVLVSSAGSEFSSTGCTLRLKNVDANLWYDVAVTTDHYFLYFYHQVEWFPAERVRYVEGEPSRETLAPGESLELRLSFTRHYGELPPGEYRLVLACQALPWDGELEQAEGFITVSFRIQEDGSGVPEETEEAKRLLGVYMNGGLWNREGRMVQVKPSGFFFPRWTLETVEDRLRLTVWRDRDLGRAEALLGDYGFVDILRGEDPEMQPSPVTAENLGSRGTLSVSPWPIPFQEPGELPEAWNFSFTFSNEGSGIQTLQVDFHYHIEVLEGDTWMAMTTTFEYPPPSFSIDERVFEIQGTPGSVTSFGTNIGRVMLLSTVYGEFDPGKEYRVALCMWEDYRNKEYYTCPLPLWG